MEGSSERVPGFAAGFGQRSIPDMQPAGAAKVGILPPIFLPFRDRAQGLIDPFPLGMLRRQGRFQNSLSLSPLLEQRETSSWMDKNIKSGMQRGALLNRQVT
jgi:hypothetical protein